MIVIIDTNYSVAPPLHAIRFGGELGSEFSRQMPSQSPMHQGVWFSCGSTGFGLVDHKDRPDKKHPIK